MRDVNKMDLFSFNQGKKRIEKMSVSKLTVCRVYHRRVYSCFIQQWSALQQLKAWLVLFFFQTKRIHIWKHSWIVHFLSSWSTPFSKNVFFDPNGFFGRYKLVYSRCIPRNCFQIIAIADQSSVMMKIRFGN